MEFDMTKVFTALNADEVKVGSKGYGSNTIKGLMVEVDNSLGNDYGEIYDIKDSSFSNRFFIKNRGGFNLFYLVEEPQKKKFRPYNDTNEMIDHFNEHFELIPQEYRLPILWIKSKSPGRKHLITDCENDCVWIGSISIKFKDLYEHYTWLDDSPCGIKED